VFERFTERARQVVVLAQEEAQVLKHNYIGTEHILLGLLREEEGLAARALQALDVTVERVRAQVVRIVGSGEEVTSGQIPFTPRTKNVLELALREALSLGHNYIGTEHILLGLAREGEGVAMRVLLDCGADSEKIRNEVIRMLSGAGAQWRAEGSATASASESRPVSRGWLGDLGGLLGRLGQEIRAELGREPDPGDLLVVLACAPGTPAAQALGELGVDVDQLWARIEHARGQARAAREALAQRILEVAQAKDRAIEDQRFEEASALRDQERQLREQARGRPRVAPEVFDEIRQRLGIPRPDDDDDDDDDGGGGGGGR
jgi:ATP-dependent Clp protease ATP-binding subunit ClpA